MTDAMTKTISDAFTSIQSDVTSMFGTALPVALAIIGLGLAITLGVKFFKKISSKA